MEPQQQAPRTTVDSVKEGRLMVDAGKRKIVKKLIKKDGKGGPGEAPKMKVKISGKPSEVLKSLSGLVGGQMGQ